MLRAINIIEHFEINGFKITLQGQKVSNSESAWIFILHIKYLVYKPVKYKLLTHDKREELTKLNDQYVSTAVQYKRKSQSF